MHCNALIIPPITSNDITYVTHSSHSNKHAKSAFTVRFKKCCLLFYVSIL